MRGRKPKPTARRRLEGNAGRRPLNTAEPQLPPLPTIDALPTELQDDAVAAKEWSRLVPLLRRAHAITEGDRAALIALCLEWSVFVDAFGQMKRKMVFRSPSGYPMLNPYHAVAHRALAHCEKLWAELGLTPTSRTRITATPGSGVGVPADVFSEFDDPLPTQH